MKYILVLVSLTFAIFMTTACGGGTSAIDTQQPAPDSAMTGTVPPLGTPMPFGNALDTKTQSNTWKGELDGVVEINGTTMRYDYFDHDYLIDTQLPVKVHNYNSVTVEGSVSNAIFVQRSAWLEIGLVSKGIADAALNNWDHPPYMFNQSAFWGCNLNTDGNLKVWPSDYDGQPYTPDPSWVVTPDANGKFNFTFEVKLVPNGKKVAGGLLYLSVNGAPYGTPVTYGQENWMWFWGPDYWYPIEFCGTVPFYDLPMDKAYVIAQAYTEKRTAYVHAEVKANITKTD